ncbi:MAG: RhsIA family immunity protein [Eubacterium sp.]|nr:RhsIA family immunity protein [Eubacterium sp.]
MGIFDKFKKKKDNKAEKEHSNEFVSEIIEPVIISDGVSEKYLPYIDEIIPAFVSMLRRLDAVEEKTNEQHSLYAENYDYFMEKYKSLQQEYGDIASELCTDEVLQRGYLSSFGKPTTYGHINKGCELEFIMKSVKQATVIMYNDRDKSYLPTYRFIFKNKENSWRINSVSYRIGDDDSWHLYNI